MLDGLTVPLLGTLDTDPDGIPRGFIHKDPDILNIQQQNTLSEMKVKMMDFNNEYLAKHPQVEALVRLLIKEIVIHKPYYVREFIKEILSRDDLESTVAKIVAAKRLNTNRRHTRHYFSHVKTWEDKAGGVKEPEAQTEEPYWPEPRPFRVETRRDKWEYCHPHYFKVPYVFFPTEFLKPKQPDFKIRKFPKFRSKSYAKIVLENFKDVWGDPITDIPPPMNDEELYTACSLLKKKSESEMTNEELIKCCLRCRRTRMRSYLYALNKKQFNDPLKKYPSYTILQKSLQLRVANKFLEKTLEALKRKDLKTIHCEWVPDGRPINEVDRELMKFETRFIPHRPLADMDSFKSPLPGIRFKEEGVFRTLLPLADLKRNVEETAVMKSEVGIAEPGGKGGRKGKITVPTTDLQGNVIEESEVSVTVRSMSPSSPVAQGSYIRLGERIIAAVEPFEQGLLSAEDTASKASPAVSTVVGEKHLLEQTRIENQTAIGDSSQSDITSTTPEGQSKTGLKKKVKIREDFLGPSRSSDLCVIASTTSFIRKEDSLLALSQCSIGEKIENFQSKKKIKPLEHSFTLPPSLMDPYMQMLVDSKRLTKHFKKENEGKRKCSINRRLQIDELENC